MDSNSHNNMQAYAYLPEDLLLDMLNDSPNVVGKLIAFTENSEEKVEDGKNTLLELDYIRTLPDDIEPSESLVAIDGATIVEKLSS